MTIVSAILEDGRRLHSEWKEALRADEQPDSTSDDTEAESAAYDKLIDFVERNGLNYSEVDPRGPRDVKQH